MKCTGEDAAINAAAAGGKKICAQENAAGKRQIYNSLQNWKKKVLQRVFEF